MRIILVTDNCAWCGEEFEYRRRGRSRKYCTDAHRVAYLRNVAQPAWHEREKRKKIARNGIW